MIGNPVINPYNESPCGEIVTFGGPKVAGDFKDLFNGIQITPVLEDQRVKLRQRVEQIPSDKLLNASEHDLVQALVQEFRLEVPVLKEE